MATWISLAVLSALAVSTLSLPVPDGAYNIPQVGTGRRSQYYVLHSDGTHKYGHDTGEGAFESARSTTLSQQQGQFGYVDPAGYTINLKYEAGEGGFVASGDHLPVPHPDFFAAHAEANARPPFVDSLANSNADASYNFQFAEEGHVRSEQSDANGNVRGSYSYTDENGQTRSYSYTAGRDTGFVVESNDLPVAPDTPEASGSTPAGTRFSSSGNRFSSSKHRGVGSSNAPSSAIPGNTASSSFATAQTTYRAPSASSASVSTHRFSNTRQPSAFGTQTFSSSSSSSSRVPFEEANTRSESRPDGSYAFTYGTSSHSKEESGDSNTNVDGNFAFVADDGQRREISYEAGSATGFIAEGAHIPVGPIVPGAPSGQPTGRIVPVQEVSFVDPLANSNSDASYNFAFDSEQYSRSETADADGNVQGTYTVVDDDGTRRVYRFRAGEGIGYETEEVSSSKGAPPSRTSPSSTSSSHSSASSNHFASASSPASTQLHGARRQSSSYNRQAARRQSSSYNRQAARRQSSSHNRQAARRQSSSHNRQAARRQSSSYNRQAAASTSAYTSASASSPDFQLHQYDASENPHKFGYVLTFGN